MYTELKKEFQDNGYTFIRTPLLQSFNLLQDQINETYYPQMVKMINLKGQIDVLRYDNTLSALQIAHDKGLDKIYTHEPVYINDFERECVKECWGISAEYIQSPSIDRDNALMQLLLSLLKSTHGESYILEWSHTDWLNLLMKAEPILLPLQEEIHKALNKKNIPLLESLLLPYCHEIRHYEDLIYLLTTHGSYEEQRSKMGCTAYTLELKDILQSFDEQYKRTPLWARPLIYLDMAYPPKLSHYTGLYFQAFSLLSNTLLASGGAYQYGETGQTGIGFVIYIEEESYE